MFSSIRKWFSSPSSVKASLVFTKSSASFTPSMNMFSPKDVYMKSSALAGKEMNVITSANSYQNISAEKYYTNNFNRGGHFSKCPPLIDVQI